MQQNPLVKCLGGHNKRVEYVEMSREKAITLFNEVPVLISLSNGTMTFTALQNGNYKVKYERRG